MIGAVSGYSGYSRAQWENYGGSRINNGEKAAEKAAEKAQAQKASDIETPVQPVEPARPVNRQGSGNLNVGLSVQNSADVSEMAVRQRITSAEDRAERQPAPEAQAQEAADDIQQAAPRPAEAQPEQAPAQEQVSAQGQAPAVQEAENPQRQEADQPDVSREDQMDVQIQRGEARQARSEADTLEVQANKAAEEAQKLEGASSNGDSMIQAASETEGTEENAVQAVGAEKTGETDEAKSEYLEQLESQQAERKERAAQRLEEQQEAQEKRAEFAETQAEEKEARAERVAELRAELNPEAVAQNAEGQTEETSQSEEEQQTGAVEMDYRGFMLQNYQMNNLLQQQLNAGARGEDTSIHETLINGMFESNQSRVSFVNGEDEKANSNNPYDRQKQQERVMSVFGAVA